LNQKISYLLFAPWFDRLLVCIQNKIFLERQVIIQ
jgi:hypothetical protein